MTRKAPSPRRPSPRQMAPGARPEPSRRVWLVTFPGAELLDLAGPWSVLAHANDALERAAYELVLVSVDGGTLPTRHAVEIGSTRSLAAMSRGPLPHTVVVAGGTPFAELPRAERAFADWLTRRHGELPRIVSICTGAFVLAAAGLLENRRATTHWEMLEKLAELSPRTEVVEDVIFVRDGRIWTSAGITAGIDLMLALVEEDHGHAVAMRVARRLVLFLRRSGGQAQFSEALKGQDTETPRLRELAAFVSNHIDEPLPIERLARWLAMSPRSLTRWFARELGESPAAFVRRLRVERARSLLSDSDLSLVDIAARTGLGDPSTLFRTFQRDVGVSPALYRRRFGRCSSR